MFDVRRRDFIVAAFRRKVYETIHFYPFWHQADWQAASEGWTFVDAEPLPGQHYLWISVPDPTDDEYVIERRRQRTKTVRRTLLPRLEVQHRVDTVAERLTVPHTRVWSDAGIPARNCTELAAYKGGKSYGLAAWAAGFACLPNAEVDFVGLEYGTSEPEFEYLCEFLCAEPPYGMNLGFTHKQNDARNGRMLLELKNGMTYVCRSWKQREQLKGRKKTAYIYTEAYQLPGMVCYTSVMQNLRQLSGWAAWATTPDRPWVGYLHDKGHGHDPNWHCTCSVRDSDNPTTFDQKARDAADPDKGGVMTREKFAIAHDGTLGKFVGRVYNMARGQHQFSPVSAPSLWRPDICEVQP